MKNHRVPEATLYGVAALDDQHRRLFGLIEKIARSADTDSFHVIEALFGTLLDLLAKHFSDEEQLMIETRYPKALEHGALHRALLAEIDRRWRRMSENGYVSKRDAHDAVDRIIRHMLLVDGPFKTHLKRIGYRARGVNVPKRAGRANSSSIVSQI